MKNTALTLIALLAAAGVAAGQTKHSGEGKCKQKPEKEESLEVGDRANHVVSLTKQTCEWTTPMQIGDLKTKSYIVTGVSDRTGDTAQERGYVTVVMDNGDKAFLRYSGKGNYKDGKGTGGDGTWSYTGGTGKLRGITGKGTYKNTGGETDQVEGEYTLPAPKATKK